MKSEIIAVRTCSIILIAIFSLFIFASDSYASSSDPSLGLTGEEAMCPSETGKLIKLEELPAAKTSEKNGLVSMEESKDLSVQPEKVLPLVVIVAGFNNMPYDNSYDWNHEVFGQQRSVRSYFLDQSYNQFTFEPATETCCYGSGDNSNVTDKINDGVIHVDLDMDHDDWGAGRAQNEVGRDTMLQLAMNEAGDYIDYRSFDTNKNGKIEASELNIYVIVAGYANEIGHHYHENIYYYHACSGIPDKSTVPNTYNIQRCATMAEYREPTSTTVAINQYSTMCHELGHNLGLRDMYDTSSSGSRPWSGYDPMFMSLMAYGNHGLDSNGSPLPTSFDPWCKIRLGWITAKTIQAPGTYSAKAIDYEDPSAGETIYKIPIKDKEYYLVENRQFVKWDEGLPRRGYTYGDGLVFWHIDDTYYGQQANNATHRPGNCPLYPEKGSLGFTFLGTSPRQYMPCFSQSFWNSNFKPNHGRFINFPTFASKEPTAGPESRELSGVRVELLSDSSSEMTFRIPDATEHDHVLGQKRENEVAATCETAGKYDLVEYCLECGAVVNRTTETVKKLGHQKKAVARVEATCENDGYRKHNECTRCGQWFRNGSKVDPKDPSVVLRATGHAWDSGSVTQKATCKEVGTRTFVCANDSEHKKTEDIDMLPHSPAEPVEKNKVEATCKDKGSYDLVTCCSECGEELEKETMEIEAKGHAYGNWESMGEQGHKRVCGNDDTHVEKEEHVWVFVGERPTTGIPSKGLKEYDCSICGEKKHEEVSYQNYDSDGTSLGEGASEELAHTAILKMADDKDPAGSRFAPLKLRSNKQKKNSIRLTWTKNERAVKYVIYGNVCNSKGKKYRMKKIATIGGDKGSYNVRKIGKKKLKKARYHKFIVVAVDKEKNVVSTSKVIHVATKGGKVTNPGKLGITVKKGKKWIAADRKSVAKGEAIKIRAKLTKQSRNSKMNKHVSVRFESSNEKVATISNGKIKGINKGNCVIYAYGQNGIYRTIKLTVTDTD